MGMTVAKAVAKASTAAGEDNSWLDPEWAAALLDMSVASAHDSRLTGCAIARDEQRVRARIRKMSPSHIKAVILSRRHSGGRCSIRWTLAVIKLISGLSSWVPYSVKMFYATGQLPQDTIIVRSSSRPCFQKA